jgi:hypothetical protein
MRVHSNWRARLVSAVVLVIAADAQAQSTAATTAIGTISGGNPVQLENRTVKRAGKEITATLRTVFLKPAKAPGGDWYGSRTVVTVRCAEGTAAVKENRYYADAKLTKVANEKIAKIPGFAAPVPGSVTAVALNHFCTKP